MEKYHAMGLVLDQKKEGTQGFWKYWEKNMFSFYSEEEKAFLPSEFLLIS